MKESSSAKTGGGTRRRAECAVQPKEIVHFRMHKEQRAGAARGAHLNRGRGYTMACGMRCRMRLSKYSNQS
eukprot:scaffold245393_cov31-Tisochrysis_lutea.AAC.3